jgi:glutamine synthetase
MSVMVSSSIAEALPSPGRVAEARARLEEAGVRYVFSCWVDLLGLPKTKPVPLAEWEELCAGRGPQFAVHSISMVPELGPADPDQVPIPDLDSLVICPWNKQYAWVFADLYLRDAPYDVCPRFALKRQVRAAAEAGYSFFVGIEPEFIVMRYDEQGRPVKAFDDDPRDPSGLRPRRQAFGYDAEFSLDAMPFLSDLMDVLDQLGWGLADVVAEGAYSQFELDFGYAPALETADRFTFLRVLLKEVAKRHGCFVTFMPKPTQGDWRSGAHISHSVQAVDRPGQNLFGDDADGWGSLTQQTLGGMIRHGRAISSVTCSTVNSYNGLIARAGGFEGGTVTWAPTHVCYGHNNRSAMYRLPQSRYAIENRASDMCMNAYLALAMTIGASLEGISQGLGPGEPVNTSLYDMSDADLRAANIEPLPGHLHEAIQAFDASGLAREVLGETMHGSYSRYKHDEWARYHEKVTEWEVEEYLRFF